MTTSYTIKSTSEDGVYYLVNGWNKFKTFWKRKGGYDILTMSFKTIGQAKTSLTKAINTSIKYDLGYENDTFNLVELKHFDGILIEETILE